MFEQFHALKAEVPDAVLLFRMGDFYETFFEDAEIAARVLELTLTARNKSDPNPIPMAGVPHHAAGGYIQRLVDAGYRVAIAEQLEDPASARGLVKRGIVRVVTPGVGWDPTSLDARTPCWLAAGWVGRGGAGLAFLDVSTGDLLAADLTDADALAQELSRLDPKELLLSKGAADAAPGSVAGELGLFRSEVAPEAWRADEAQRLLKEVLGVADLTGFGLGSAGGALRAAGAALRYARDRLGGELRNVTELRTFQPASLLGIDAATRRHLELTRTTLSGQRRGSLLDLLDVAHTPLGSRRLAEWLACPLRDVAGLQRRQLAVEALVDAADRREALRASLRQVADVERLCARVAQGTANGRDLLALRGSLLALPALSAAAAQDPRLSPWLPADPCDDVAQDLSRWLADDPPTTITEGGLLREGCHDELDTLRDLALNGRAKMQQLEAREREATGIGSLKVRQSGQLGWYFELSLAKAGKLPDRFIARQTLKNSERFITAELKELEEDLTHADARRLRLEHALFLELRCRVAAHLARLNAVGRAIADLDALAAMAEVAVRHRWVRPELVDAPRLQLEGARHPVVEAHLREERFIPNDVRLDAEGRRLNILTGPNMAGKSTVLRMTALAVILAQMGSFVPASRAVVGLCDQVFTRVGAADDLSAGRSTFMVEMSETAGILRHATSRSLVILDEIGRGTATYDGLSIAWAVAEDLAARVQCRAMFATHYHELCELAQAHPEAVFNQSVAARVVNGRMLFLRQLQDGGANRSYGIDCARLAGLPPAVVKRARGLLAHFEKHAPRDANNQLSLFGHATASQIETIAPTQDAARPLLEAIAAIQPDDLSPRDALDALYRLRAMAAALEQSANTDAHPPEQAQGSARA